MPGANSKWCLVCDQKLINSRCSFHRFPKDDFIKQKWMVWGINNGLLTINDDTRNVFICSCHFQPQDFKNLKNNTGISYLKKTAVPFYAQNKCMGKPGWNTSLNQKQGKNTDADVENTILSEIKEENTEIFNLYCQTSGEPSIVDKNIIVENTSFAGENKSRKFRYTGDFTSDDMDDPVKAKKFHRLSLDKMSNQAKEIIALRRRIRRLNKRVKILKELTCILQTEN